MADDAKPFWATVDETDPLAVRKDGETEPIAASPDSLVDPYHLRSGDRVRCTLHHKRVQILGKVSGNFHMRWSTELLSPTTEETSEWNVGLKAISLSGFVEKPLVTVSLNTEVPYICRVAVTDRDKDGFTIVLNRTNDTDTWVTWLAYGY